MSTATKGRHHVSTAARVWVLLVLTLLLLLTATAGAAHAQGNWTLIGFVKDDEGNPVENVQILLGGLETRALTDENGRFYVQGVSLGLNYVAARRIGFLPVADLVRLVPSDTLNFVMEKLGQHMDTVKVKSRAEAAWERDMQRYAWATETARSSNSVITDRDIRERGAIFTTDLLASRAGFNVVGQGGSARVVSSRARCSPTVFLDGQPLTAFNVNDILPSTIKLMVTYPGFSNMPVQLQSMRVNPNCGVISILSL